MGRNVQLEIDDKMTETFASFIDLVDELLKLFPDSERTFRTRALVDAHRRLIEGRTKIRANSKYQDYPSDHADG